MKAKKKLNEHAPGHNSGSTLFQNLIIGGIALSSTVLLVSLLAYFHPTAVKDTFHTISSQIVSFFNSHNDEETEAASAEAGAEDIPESQEPAQVLAEAESSQDDIPYMVPTSELGQISDLDMEVTYGQDSAVYSVMLDTSMGPMLYYNQGDSRWADFPYGGADPLKKYGCGPAAVSMLVNSFSPAGVAVTPTEMADWAAANGCYAPQSGSYHKIIPESLKAFGLEVESVKNRSADHVKELLNSGHMLAALMGKGALTDNGHFVLITKLLDNGYVHIADPNSLDNSTKEWDLAQLLDELKESYDSGGPLWAVSYPDNSS